MTGQGARAVFVDRDGVLTRSLTRRGRPYAPRSLSEFEILTEAPDAVRALKDAGYLVIVVTNQKDVGTGLMGADVLAAMHERLREAVPVDDIFVCTCVDECRCYKPRPGMLLDAAERWGIDLGRSYMVGDRWRDVGAGRAAGCITFFIDRHYDEPLRDKPDHTVGDIAEAAELILRADAAVGGGEPCHR